MAPDSRADTNATHTVYSFPGMWYDPNERVKELEGVIKQLKQELHRKEIEIQQYRRRRFK